MSFEKPKLNKSEKWVTIDREAEKEKRKEVRKLLEHALTEALKPAGFKKEGLSTWLRKIENKIQMIYLQRSQWGHSYYLEAGVCDSKDLGDKPPHITDCHERKRLEGIVSELNPKKYQEKEQEITDMLEFEVPDAIKKYPDGELRPSIDIKEAQNKIESLRRVVEENMPLWLDEKLKI